jgi:hypothetical protein
VCRQTEFTEDPLSDRASLSTALANVEMKRPELIRAADRSVGHQSHLRKVSEMCQRS